jgi:hypothetical protein
VTPVERTDRRTKGTDRICVEELGHGSLRAWGKGARSIHAGVPWARRRRHRLRGRGTLVRGTTAAADGRSVEDMRGKREDRGRGGARLLG